ncbi:MAG: hypothetical protein IGS50_17750 [Synechococcales cyanobacterium C42_A2020_086]|jgi:hypothetical protein|nr:hypothetical protein [Synechococcales cyanobacterium C42_A2020_086]
MIDLAILLSIALAVTAALGLLLAGFVWTPWLIGLALVVLLVALMWLTRSSTGWGASVDGSETQPAAHTGQQSGQHPPNQPVLHYRGAECRPTPGRTGSAAQMTYRGVKYTATSSSSTHSEGSDLEIERR